MANPVVLYDGECGLCNYWVQWILDRDERRIFRFATLQSRFSREMFHAFQREVTDRSLVVLTEEGEFITRSKAVAYLFLKLKPKSFFRYLLMVTPGFLADLGYNGVAAIRKIFHQGSCRLFTSDERALFINSLEYTRWIAENSHTKKEDSFPHEDKKL